MKFAFLLAVLLVPAAAYAPGALAPAGAARASAVMMAKKKGKGGAGGAAKVVQVMLTAPVKGLGKKGDLVAVKPAYAENMLIRAGLGALATPEMLQAYEAEQAEAAANASAAAAKAAADAATLGKVFSEGCVVKKKVGPDGSIFGSVSAAEIATLVTERSGVSVDKKSIDVPAFSKIGTGVAEVALHKTVSAKLKIVVVPASL